MLPCTWGGLAEIVIATVIGLVEPVAIRPAAGCQAARWSVGVAPDSVGAVKASAVDSVQ